MLFMCAAFQVMLDEMVIPRYVVVSTVTNSSLS
jgi:hypothetical protein